MYLVRQAVITESSDLYEYMDHYAHLAKLLYNASLFRIRQIFTGFDSCERSVNEREVFEEVAVLQRIYPAIHVKRVISYSHLEKLMRATENPDFFAGLPMQTAQQIVKSACNDFANWLKALKKYHASPEEFLGRPRMPHYKKSDICSYTVTNQDAVLYPGADGGCMLKLPRTGIRYFFPNLSGGEILKEVKVIPYYGRYILSLTMEVADHKSHMSGGNLAGIDFGVNNIAALVCTDGSSVIYKGGAILSENQKFAMQRAKYTGIITKGHSHRNATSKKLINVSYHHANFNRDQMHKISASIISWCKGHSVSTLVLGVNRNWKQNVNIGTANNQRFVAMPLHMLQQMIIYKAERAGINVVIKEESYTSKADATALDPIPTYGKNDNKVPFSGSRICRGLYRCHDGMLINADCNAAANIIRKAFADAFNDTESFAFLASPEVLGFHELNPQSITQRKIS